MTVEVGDAIPPWTIDAVDPQRMKTMAALLQDPYPIHWDTAATAALGLGDRVINQGPLGVGYIANLLLAWQGDGCLRRLTTRFVAPVYGGDPVTAGGTVTEIVEADGERRAHCEVWLDADDRRAITGTATVRLQ